MATTSGFLSLNLADLSKGLILAVITSVLTLVQTSLSAGKLTFDWKAIGIVAATTAVGYLLHALTQPAVLQTPVPNS